MLPLIRYRHALLAILLVAGAGLVAGAYADPQSDPPSRVGRLNYISGQVSFRPASLDDWGVATINYPLTTGDHLWTERDATAELHVASSVIRLAPETAFSFLNLDDDVMQARVAEGTVDVRIREIFDRQVYELDTPNAAISILAPGIYRVDVDPDGGRTRVTVRTGEVEVDGNGRTFSVYPGQMADVIGDEDGGYALRRAAAPDRWELWCRDRDRREDNRLALNYVSRDMVGYEDLDDYGAWSYEPDYGYGWTPTVVAVDWAPYRYGHWSYVRPWGWTWIDGARWGFAPFHYGRWAFRRGHWTWFPGHRAVRPVWAPALVAFVGGSHWDFSFAFGVRPAVGWFPLAPGEAYCPSYYASRVYVHNLNVTNVNVTNINITNINVANQRYANRSVTGAMTAVPRDMFAAAQPAQRVGVAVPRYAATQTPVTGHAAVVTPGPASVIGRVPAAASRPAPAVMQRPVIVRNQPPASAARTAPVVASSERGRPSAIRSQAVEPQAPATHDGSARPSPYGAGNEAVRPPATTPREESGATTDSRSNRGDVYAVPRNATRPDRTVEPDQPRGWQSRPSVRSTETPAPRVQQNDRPSDNASQPRSERATPRNPAARDEAPGYNRQTPREERPAPVYERSTPRDERPSGGVRESSAPDRSARPRDENRSPAPARAERTETPRPDTARSETRGASPAPTPSARPADRGAERPQPQPGGGRGGQSQGSARPRGGRGGDKQ